MVGGLKMCLLGVASVVTLGCLNKANNGVDIPVVLISESGRIRLTDGRTVSSIEDGVNFLPMRGDWSMGVEIALDNGITVGDLFKGMGILSVAGVWDFYVKGGGGGRMFRAPREASITSVGALLLLTLEFCPEVWMANTTRANISPVAIKMKKAMRFVAALPAARSRMGSKRFSPS